LAREACRRLAEIGVRNARIRCGDGFEGWPEHAPYDAILLTAAPVALPPRLLDQLRPGGRLVAPIGPAEGAQSLTLVTRRADGARDVEEVMGVRFVPMLPGVAADG
ncbi:MAG: protein-L-isoaspartate O-methyltransferase, partial [Verrucomicrobiae bacterium]|nr:protein-L-isoaspartate O-methyltransferase [Verrucomicrobiae bacterium]